jgi:hypothetical protein
MRELILKVGTKMATDLETLIRIYDQLVDVDILESTLSEESIQNLDSKVSGRIDSGVGGSYLDLVRWGVLDAIDELKPGLGDRLPGMSVEIVISRLKEGINEG